LNALLLDISHVPTPGICGAVIADRANNRKNQTTGKLPLVNAVMHFSLGALRRLQIIFCSDAKYIAVDSMAFFILFLPFDKA
jgi:hypothetical protein